MLLEQNRRIGLRHYLAIDLDDYVIIDRFGIDCFPVEHAMFLPFVGILTRSE